MSGIPRRDRDWAICVPERWTATWPVGKMSRKKKEGADLLFGGEPRRLDRGQRFARAMHSFARTFSISSAPSVSSDSSYFFSSYHRIARLCMRRARYFGAQPWRVDALTHRFDFLIPARSSTLIPEVELETEALGVSLLIPRWSSPLRAGHRFWYANVPCRRRSRMNRALLKPHGLFFFFFFGEQTLERTTSQIEPNSIT